jgi:MraZ protein
VFKGTYRYRVDPKGRIPVPPAFRPVLLGSGGRAVVTLVDQCLGVYAPNEWARLEDQLRALPAFSARAKALTRLLLSRAADVELDVQGRVLVPPNLRAAAEIKSEVVVIGVLDRFELWAPERWDGFLRESERLLDDVGADLAWPTAGPSTPAPAAVENPVSVTKSEATAKRPRR